MGQQRCPHPTLGLLRGLCGMMSGQTRCRLYESIVPKEVENSRSYCCHWHSPSPLSSLLGPHQGGAWEDREEGQCGTLAEAPLQRQCQPLNVTLCKRIKVIQMAGVFSHLPEANVNLLRWKVSCQTSNYICLLLYTISSTQLKMTGRTK